MRRELSHMKKSIVVTAILAIFTLMAMTSNKPVAAQTGQPADFDINFSANNYYTVLNGWLNDKVAYGRNTYTFTPDDFVGGERYTENESHGYPGDTVYVGPGDSITFEVDVPSAGLYQIYYDYYVTT